MGSSRVNDGSIRKAFLFCLSRKLIHHNLTGTHYSVTAYGQGGSFSRVSYFSTLYLRAPTDRYEIQGGLLMENVHSSLGETCIALCTEIHYHTKRRG